MPFPETIRTLTRDHDFWRAFLLEPDPPAAAALPDELRITFPVAGGYGLVLDLDLPYREHRLGLRHPGATEPVELARIDAAHRHPYALRWTELDLIGRVIALDDPSLPHPGLPTALLFRFAPTALGDDATVAAEFLSAALRSLRRPEPALPLPRTGPEQPPLALFEDPRWWPAPPPAPVTVLDEQRIAAQVRENDARSSGFAWRHRHGWGWVAAGDDEPDTMWRTTRARGNENFPFYGLAELLKHARRRLAGLLDAPWRDPDTVIPLARRICDTGDLTEVPALAAALERAGCDHPTVMDALTAPLVPAQACWVVEALVWAEPGTMARRHFRSAPG
ncbi:hypothetical protein SAMN05444365_101992 [Micromonospora pattaloongensis]|uniref:Uncharacterized protein n=1 Tax=Micromonospora pattaloongensis TaxID=405436 RepID=A0A1H3HU97_9ACTN|nr:hypothetical protein [Micromonospora pattaloongensis]SDY19063.1 hypothetical protein SAMN05444365_101992 [Micromonospora pattaloongensis]